MRSFTQSLRSGGLLSAAVALALACLFAAWACMHQFGGYDLSPLIDLEWRLNSGEAPGRNFIDTWPLIILLATKFAGWLRFDWLGLTLANMIFTVLAFVAVMAMSSPERRSSGWPLAVAIIFAVPLIYANHIWHSSLSQLAACLFVFPLYEALRTGTLATRTTLGLLFGAAFLALSKQNVAVPLLVTGLFLSLAIGGGQRWRPAALILTGAIIGVITGLLILDMPLAAFRDSYLAVLGRGLPGDEMIKALTAEKTNAFAVILFIASAIVTVSSFLPFQRKDWPEAVVLLLLFGVAMLPFLTDWDTKLENVSFPLFIAATRIMRPDADAATLGQVKALRYALLIAVSVALYGGVTRDRMHSVGPTFFWEEFADQQITGGYFDGLIVGPRMAKVLPEMAALKAANPNARLFFGPRIEFGYAITGTPSPQAMPLWWHKGSSYANADEPKVIAAFIANRFDLLVFIGKDRTRMPQQLLNSITANFAKRPSNGELQVWERKPASAAPQ